MKYCAVVLFAFFIAFAVAQTGTDSFARKLHNPPSCECINPQFLLGPWETMDTNKYRVEFLFHRGMFILANDTNGYAKESFVAYEFFRKDSFTVSNAGIIIKWPPDACRVKQLGADSIQIEYENFGDTSRFIRYKRVIVKDEPRFF